MVGMYHKLNIKALSSNKMWQGRRFRTREYDQYEQEIMLLLPRITVSSTDKLEITIIVGFSNKMSDIDNIAKPLIDILQKAYLFNDRNIWRLVLEKGEIVTKGSEYIKFSIASYGQQENLRKGAKW